MPAAPFGSGIGDLVTTDFTVTFNQTELTGVEREPDASTQKATMAQAVAMATPKARQFAVVAEAVPAKLFDSQDALRAFPGHGNVPPP